MHNIKRYFVDRRRRAAAALFTLSFVGGRQKGAVRTGLCDGRRGGRETNQESISGETIDCIRSGTPCFRRRQGRRELLLYGATFLAGTVFVRCHDVTPARKGWIMILYRTYLVFLGNMYLENNEENNCGTGLGESCGTRVRHTCQPAQIY